MSKADAVEGVGQLIAAFRQEKIVKETVELYVRELSDLRRDALQFAVKRIIRTSKFFPSVAELLEMAKEAPPLPTPPPYALLGEPFSQDPGPCPTCGEHFAVIVEGLPEPCLWCVIAAAEAQPQPAADAPPAPEV